MNAATRRAVMFAPSPPLPTFAWEPAVERALSLDPQAWQRAFGEDVEPARAALPAIVELYVRAVAPPEPISLSSAAVWLSDLQRKSGARASGEIVQLALNADPPCSRACVATIVRIAYWSRRDFDAFVAGFMRMAADAGGIATKAGDST